MVWIAGDRKLPHRAWATLTMPGMKSWAKKLKTPLNSGDQVSFWNRPPMKPPMPSMASANGPRKNRTTGPRNVSSQPGVVGSSCHVGPLIALAAEQLLHHHVSRGCPDPLAEDEAPDVPDRRGDLGRRRCCR